MAIFGNNDVVYLATHLSSDQLCREIEHAGIKELASREANDGYEKYWSELRATCCLALNVGRDEKVGDGNVLAEQIL